jgi:hypothetical protein
MMEGDKPNYASVTNVLCTCRVLDDFARNPETPIVFDAHTCEFQIKCRDDNGNFSGVLVIYHCPFCGGSAPRSQRKRLFTKVTSEEEARLAELLAPIQTITDALTAFGVPDYDGHTVTHMQECEGQPPKTTYQREIRYRHQSEIADVAITERPDGRIFWSLYGKELEGAQLRTID